MTYFVVCYPTFDEPAYRWIQTIRHRYDPQATLIAPHVTLAFGIEDQDEGTLLQHLRAKARRPKISAVFSAIECHEGFGEAGHYAYLVPDPGRSELEAIYEDLHRGPLAAPREGAPAFVPHVTLGRAEDQDVIVELVASYPLPSQGVSAALASMTLIDVDGGRLRQVAEFPLGDDQI